MLLSDMLIKKPYMYKIKKAYYTNILNKLINIIFLFFIFERFDSEGNGFIHIENITIRNTGKMKISTNSRWRDMLSVECVESRFNGKIGKLEWPSKSLAIGAEYSFAGFKTRINRQKPTDCHILLQSDFDDNIVESNKQTICVKALPSLYL